MEAIVEDLEGFTPKRISIAITERYEQELLMEFLRDALRRGLAGDLEDLCRQILRGLN